MAYDGTGAAGGGAPPGAAGVKVASCVALFAYGRTGCALVDTWIQKVIRQEYQGRSPFRGTAPTRGSCSSPSSTTPSTVVDGPA